MLYFVVNCPFIPMLFSTFWTRKKNSDFSIFHLISGRIHCPLTSGTPISRYLTIYMPWCKTKRTVITTSAISFWNFLSTVKASKSFVNGFHQTVQQREINCNVSYNTHFYSSYQAELNHTWICKKKKIEYYWATI